MSSDEFSNDDKPLLRSEKWAEDHLGLVTLTAARACGMTDHQVRGCLHSGRWVKVAMGVYRVRGAPLGWRQAALAACLAGPAGTFASHITGVALHGLTLPSPLPHVIVPPGTSGRMRIAQVHHAALDRRDVRQMLIPVTSPARSLLDAAGLLDTASLITAVDDALCRKLVDLGSIDAAVARSGRRPAKGTTQLRVAVAAWSPRIEPGSPAEMRLVRLLDQWGYPPPRLQYKVHDASGMFIGRADIAWPEWQFGLEYEGVRFHNPREWEHDELRYARLKAAGWRFNSVDKHDLLPGRRRFQIDLERAWSTVGARTIVRADSTFSR